MARSRRVEWIIKVEDDKGKGKGKEKQKVKGKAQLIDDKAEGPPLANYIKASEFIRACKMCPNPDWHPTFQCPNLTPALKERLKEARSKCRTMRASHPDDFGCNICLKTNHISNTCPPARISEGCICWPFCSNSLYVLWTCGKEKPHPGERGLHWKARATLRPALTYPNVKEQLKQMARA